MANNRKPHSYIIVDPNTPPEAVRLLRQILTEKLLSGPADGTASP